MMQRRTEMNSFPTYRPPASFRLAVAMAIVMGLSITWGTTPTLAQATPTPKQLMEMIQAQQKQLDGLKAALLKSQRQAEAAASKSSLLDKVQVGGVVEVEATSTSGFDGTDSSDIALATVEVFVDAQLHDYLSTHVQVIYEDEGDTINFDEAFATVGNTEKFPLYLTFGKGPMPFGGQGGGFDTDISSDPLTKNLGEVKEAAVELGAVYEGLTVRGYIYNGDTQQDGSGDLIDQFGLAAAYSGEVKGAAFNLGASYINNIADSDGLTALTTVGTSLVDYVAGIDVHGDLSVNNFTFRAGYMTALDSFDSTEVVFNGLGAKPMAWHVDAAYTTEILGKETVFAVTMQGTDEALALSLPETRYGVAVTVGIVENFAVTAEYLHDEDYGTVDGGTGESGNTATLKLAAEF